MKYTTLDKAVIDDIWGNFVFRPAITKRFVDYTTAEARWAIEKGVFPADTTVPDFSSVLCPDILRDIDPRTVQLQ